MAGNPWAALVQPEDDGLLIRFASPVREIRLTPETARQLAAILLVAAEGLIAAPREDDPQAMTVRRWS